MTELRLHCATLMVMSSIRGLCVRKRKTRNSWYLIVVENMADEKYDVMIGDHLAVEVKWRYRQNRGQFCT